MSDENELKATDLLGVRSRLNWSAIVAGAVVAVTLYTCVMLVGLAIGITAAGRVGDAELGWGSVIWSVVASLTSLFIGGFVSTKTTAGETKGEGFIYGVLVWSLILVFITQMNTSLATNTGVGQLFQRAMNTDAAQVAPADLGDRGVTPEQMGDEKTDQPKRLAEKAQEQVRGMSPVVASWSLVAGIALSLVAAILGAVVGAGPDIELNRIKSRRTVVVRT